MVHSNMTPIVLYDGTCGLCHRLVRWIMRHEREPVLQFAPLQGETAAALRARFPNIPGNIDTVVLVDDDRAYLRSKAILRSTRYLHAPWRWAYALRWLPAPLLDLGYRVVAAVRYRLFGRADACEVPAPAQRARFLA
jgi:predicted DCC family thiol-disulfide oxidoreductase YuxK